MQISKLSICRLLGSSTVNANQIAYAQGCLLYLCGSYVIFYNPAIDEQIAYLKHSTPQINCLCVSEDGRRLAIGCEGKYNNIYVYDLNEIGEEDPELLYVMKGHKNGVDLLAFSKGGKYLISVGNKDGSMFIWEKQERLSQNRNSRTLNRIIFDQNGDLITVGRGHCKVWPFEEGSISRVKEEDCWMIAGKSLNLGKKFALKEFVDVVSWRQYLIVLTSDGILCLVSKKEEKLQKCIDLMMEKTTSMDLIANLIMCGGDNSLIKVINLQTLSLHSKFPKPPPTNKENISVDEQLSYNQNQQFPRTVGLRRIGEYIITLYSNLTMFIWNFSPEMHALRSIITHKNKIRAVKVLEEIKGDIAFFSTISTDNTLRIWHYYKKCFHNRESIDIADLIGIKRNAYCRNLTRIIYTEADIICISGYLNQSVACVSNKEFIMYSLDNFQISSHDVFAQNAISLDIRGNLAYVGFQSGKVCIYQVSDSLAKMRQIQFETNINSMKLIDDSIVVGANDQIVIYSLKRSSISHVEKNSTCYAGSGHHIFTYKNDHTITVYNTAKSKASLFVSLKHQLDENEEVIKLSSNSWLVIAMTNRYKIIIVNFSSAIIHTEKFSEPLNDICLTENGQVIIVGDFGNIMIRKLISDQKFQPIENQMKNWIEKNDLSWMNGSVWSRKKSNIEESNKLINSVQNIAERAESIKLGQPDRSLKAELPNVQINYKSSANSMSIFNPSNIAQQANQIYNQVNGIIKAQSEADKSSKLPKKKIFNNPPRQQPNQNLDTLLLTNPMLKMESQKQHVPKFNDNLVTSIVHSVHQPEISKQRPEQHSFQDFFQAKKQEQKEPLKSTESKLIREMNELLDRREFLDQHQEQLGTIYQKLQMYFGNKTRYQKGIKEKFESLSKEFLNFLSTQP